MTRRRSAGRAGRGTIAAIFSGLPHSRLASASWRRTIAVVGGEPKVAFDPGGGSSAAAKAMRLLENYKPSSAAVGEAAWPWVEGIRP